MAPCKGAENSKRHPSSEPAIVLNSSCAAKATAGSSSASASVATTSSGTQRCDAQMENEKGLGVKTHESGDAYNIPTLKEADVTPRGL